MNIQPITELSVAQIHHRGVPNQECVEIRANMIVDLGQFGLMLGLYVSPNAAQPYFDNLFWFGNGIIRPGDHLFVYTGPGNPVKFTAPNGINNVFNLFWGKPHTLFANTNIAPILFRVDAVDVLPRLTDQNQYPQYSLHDR